MGTTKFDEVAAQLAARVREGRYATTQKLPSEYDLAKEFGVSRLTVRKAIDALVQRQVLVKDPGKGTYVMSGHDPAKVESGRLGLQGFTEAAKAYGQTSRTEVLHYGPLPDPSATVREKLELDRRLDPTVVSLTRRRFWGDDPMTLEQIVICAEYVRDALASDFAGSLFALLSQRVDIAYSHQEIEAILVDAEMSRLLKVPVGDPLLRVASVTYTADAKPIFYDTSYYRADKYTFKSTLTRFGRA
ncbi:GntR family transcriptional regulator, LSA1692 subfamily [Lacticaseibacillus daqingensis]|uniref:GntR family transcriptional regulator, LSA1692 subfamily n=1 Tax=Lacticaseibacillus daqingensis TaxID=2486014 RepID=UPI000F7B37B4|nr:GntR family transcriptional regulator, LSA1692 subfamily [Lacticaseibacillus daqingensis]